MHQSKLYENVVIGNFLYGLGSAVRAKSKSRIVVSSVNLLQQTPADTELADVLLEFPGIVRLIEFKQAYSDLDKERAKLRNLEARIGGNEKLINISKSIHWFVETTPQNYTFISRIVPYLYLEAYSRDQTQHDLAKFIEDIAEDAVNSENQFEREELRTYLKLVKKINAEDSNSTSGLLLAINSRGNLCFVELTSMYQLRLLHREFVKNIRLQYERTNAAEQTLKYNQEKQLKKDSRYPSGPDLSL